MANKPIQQQVTKKHLARLEKERIQQRNLLTVAIIIGVLIVGVILYGVLDQTFFQARRPVAKVGNETLTLTSFQKEARFQRYQLINQLENITSDPMMLQFFGSYAQQIYGQLASTNAIGQQVVDTMVEDALVAQEAQRRGITISEAELEIAFQEAFGFFAQGTPTPTVTFTPFSTSTLSPQQETLLPPTREPDVTVAPPAEGEPTLDVAGTPFAVTPEASTPEVEPTAEAAVEAEPTATVAFTPTPAGTPTVTPTPTQYTEDLFRTNVDQYVDSIETINYSRDDLRSLIRRQLLRQKVYDAITADVPVMVEQVWARHILVATEEEAQQVRERLSQGENFAELASELSLDTSNKDQGGDLGWFTRERMVEPFADAAFSLDIGEISQPVESSFGYHIIQVLGHEERNLEGTQVQEARDRAYQDWLTSAKESTSVQIYDETWQASVPTDPAVPTQILQVLQALNTTQQQGLPIESLPIESLPSE